MNIFQIIKYLKKVLITLFLVFGFSLVSLPQSIDYQLEGTYGFKVPAGVTSIIIECWGAGGAGGGNPTNNDGGGGGGGGAYSRSVLSVVPGTLYDITIGGGGTGSTGNGTDGGDSKFAIHLGAALVLAKGGTGGDAPNLGNGGIGGAGGQASASIGEVVYNGGNGGTGRNNGTGIGGPGGSSAGIMDPGISGPLTWTTQTAEPAPTGGGKGGDGGASNRDGAPGITPGGGGGGSGDGNQVGGNGSDGKVSISFSSQGFTVYDTYFIVPGGVSSVTVEAWGGGGGGGSRSTNGRAGGGGGGAYAMGVVNNLTPGQSISVVVGEGGGANTAGGYSSFNGVEVLANGGGGGTMNNTAAGAGGDAGTSVGTVKYSGGNGATGGSTWSGGGGGGAGNTGDGGDAPGADGSSGAAGTGTELYGGDGGRGVNTSAGGNPGIIYGGGGSGARKSNGGTKTGGSGANGYLMITWTPPVFYSTGSGDPAALTSWKTTGNLSPLDFTTAGQTFIIKSGDVMTTSGAGWTVSGKGSKIIIQNGSTLIENADITVSNYTVLRIDDGAILNHNVASSSVFAGTEIIGSNSVVNYGFGGDQVIEDELYGNLTVSGSGLKTMGTSTVSGIFSVEGSATVSAMPSYTANSALQYKGSVLQTTGPEFPAIFTGAGGIIVDNSAGLTLNDNRTVASKLIMNNGNINTGSYTLTLDNSNSANLIHTSGSIIGKFTRKVASTSADYLFPAGTASWHRPAVMNFSSLSGTTYITCEFSETSPGTVVPYFDGSSKVNNAFSEGFWSFSNTGSVTATYSIELTGNGFSSYLLDATTRIMGRTSSNSTWRALGIHDTWSGSTVSRTGLTTLDNTSFDFAFGTCQIAVSQGFGYERTITIDHTKIAGGTDLFNFPVLVSFSHEESLKNASPGRVSSPNGYDIAFTDKNYNYLDHQLEYYNGTDGDLIAWVRIPTLSVSTDTEIKILYGNPQVTSDPSVTTVWDSQYKGIWHMNDNTLKDATAYNKPGTPYNSPSFPAGVIKNGLWMNGINQYASVLDAPNLNFAGNITVSAWIYMNQAGIDQKIAGNQNNSSGGFKFGVYSNNKVEFEIRNSSNVESLNRGVEGGTVLNTGRWYYVAGMSSDVLDSIKTFVNGVAERPYKKTGTLATASDDVVIGREPFTGLYYFSGMFDELRISDKVRSDGWLRTEYLNQSSPSTFYSLGIETVSDDLPSISTCDGPLTLTFGYPAGGTYSGTGVSGNVFTAPAAGTYAITYTIAGDCGPVSVTKNILVTGQPPLPVAPDVEFCSDQIAYLQATTGENFTWYLDGNPVSTANPYSPGISTPGTYTYTVTQKVNGCESLPETVILNIYTSVSINAQPEDSAFCTGENAVFTIDASGYNETYQWQDESGLNLSDGAVYQGVNTNTLVLVNPGVLYNGKSFRCVVTSTCGTAVTSNLAALTITPQPEAAFSFPDSPYCPNSPNPSPVFSGGGVAGVFSSAPGLIFTDVNTGVVNLAASTRGDYTVTNTIAAAGGCDAVIATSPLSIIKEMVWTGAGSSDWTTPGNWECVFVPGLSDDVRISEVTNNPVIGSASTGAVNNLTIDAGSELIVSGTLQIGGTITNSGIFRVPSGTVEMAGSVPQNIPADIFDGDTLRNLVVNNVQGVTVQGPLGITGSLQIDNGNLESGGYITLLSTPARTAYVDGSGTGELTGNITMQRYLGKAYGYKYFSSPFHDSKVSEFGDEIDLNQSFAPLYKYVENRLVYGVPVSGWERYTNTDSILHPVNGYSVNFANDAPLTVDAAGIVNNGALLLNVYNHNQTYTKGFNLVGNPYPSAIDWDLVAAANPDIEDAVYLFNATDRYNGVYTSYVNGVPATGNMNIIPSMQGFFIHVPLVPGSAVLNLDNSMRIGDLTHSFVKSFSKTEKPLIKVTAGYSGYSLTDPAIIYTDVKATDNFDKELDALKLFNTAQNVPNFYSLANDNSQLSINGMPYPIDKFPEIPLGIRTKINAEVVFHLTREGSFPAGVVYLYDAVKDSVSEISSTDYRVYLNAGTYDSRFFLQFDDLSLEIINHERVLDPFRVYSSGSTLYAEVNCLEGMPGYLRVISLTGQTLFEKKLYENGLHEFNLSVSDGIYIVNFRSGNTNVSRKIFIMPK